MSIEIMDIAEAATYLNIKKGTLYRLAKSGQIPGTKIGGQWRFKRERLDELFRTSASADTDSPE
ncbi:MAG: helix-turn-helix domain-containing protein [bacterium]|nr:helix-turn-helix domain-containing protein [Gemmatimonadota bacterium]